MRKYFRPLFFLGRSLLVLFYIKIFHKAKGWKFFFGSFGCIRINQGALSISNGAWIDSNCLIHCFGGTVTLGRSFFMNRNCMIVSACSITIGNNVLIADNVSIYDHDHIVVDPNRPYGQQGYTKAPVIIEDNVWIGSHSVILKGVTLGKGSVIAAGSVVIKSVPSRELWGGSPAKYIKKLDK
jgi:acetyltransferase-like isoleucine patch superfamily enzyme